MIAPIVLRSHLARTLVNAAIAAVGDVAGVGAGVVLGATKLGVAIVLGRLAVGGSNRRSRSPMHV